MSALRYCTVLVFLLPLPAVAQSTEAPAPVAGEEVAGKEATGKEATGKEGATEVERSEAGAGLEAMFMEGEEIPPVADEETGAYDNLQLPWLRAGDGGVALEWSGSILAESHYRIAEKVVGEFYNRQTLAKEFARHESSLNLRLAARAGLFSGVADLDFDWLSSADQLTSLDAVGQPELLSPYRLQAHALYLEGADLFFDGLDVKIGQQVAAWGVADQFNPTNTVNPPDLENVLFFGRQVANLMARVDTMLGDEWSATAVFVPVFKPALLPATASLGLANTSQLPFVDRELRWRLHAERDFAFEHDSLHRGAEYPTVAAQLTPLLPEPRIQNAQWAVRLGGSLLDQDVGLSYYYGRTPFPVAVRSHTRQRTEEICDPNAPEDCIVGLLETETTVRYPRMQVLGFNMAGEVNPLGWIADAVKPLGYRLEVGLYLPNARRHILSTEEVRLLGVTQEAGEYDYNGDGEPGGPRPLVVDDVPFLKWTVGLDYSLGRHLYFNLMWVHGLVDEYGAGDWLTDGEAVRAGRTISRPDRCVVIRPTDAQCAGEVVEETLRNRLGDYLVVGADLKLLDERLLMRLFTIWDLGGITIESWEADSGERQRQHHGFLTAEGLSAIIYPEVQYNFGNGLQLGVGAFLQLGESYTKFGDPAAGGSTVWARGTYAF